MENEEILEKLRDVKNTVEKDISESEEDKNEVVQNVKYYGTIELTRRDDGEKESFELYTVEIYDYKTDELETKIYLDGQEVDIGEIMRTYEDINPIKDVINKAKEQEEKGKESQTKDLNKMEQEKLLEYAEKTGKEKEDIEEIDELELDQELGKDDEEEETIDKNTANSLSRKEEVNLNQQIKGKTLRNALGLEGDYVKIAIVSSSQVNQYTNPEKIHGNIDSFVAIKANGETVVLSDDIIRADRQEGTNSTEQDLTANVDGRVDYENNRSSYQIVNSPNLYLKVGYDENHGREVKVEDRSRGKGAEGIAYELETSNTWRADDDERRMQREKNGIHGADEAIEEQKKHEDVGCENDRVENIDDYSDNDEHRHEEYVITPATEVPGKDVTFDEWAEELGENTKKLIERFEREIEKHPKDKPENLVKDIDEDYERFIPQEHRR